MGFDSILYDTAPRAGVLNVVPRPDCVADLNLDQVFADLMHGREAYNLAPFFYELPQEIDTALYRQHVMQDLAQTSLRACVMSFASKMQSLREQTSRVAKLHYERQRERVFLDAVAYYCEAVVTFQLDLAQATPNSHGMLAFREYLAGYIETDRFTTLLKDMTAIKTELSEIDYQLLIRDSRITVKRSGAESDYGADIGRTFGRFRQSAAPEYAFKSRDYLEMNHIEAGVLDLVAKLFPDHFARLAHYFAAHQDFLDLTIERYDREVQFYLCYLDYIGPLRKRGLRFCYPTLSTASKAVHSEAAFDIALAHKLAEANSPIVVNDFDLQGDERILVVTGPNQGGKTTFARMFGQLHYLARLGYPVPGVNARLFFFDKVLTHFEREEDISTHRGKLEDELIRSRDIINQATSQSIVILNEVFTSTSLQDALFLARRLVARLLELDLLCVCVTFMEELSRIGPATVSYVSAIVPDRPSERTFRVLRKRADGRSYAASIAEKHGLTYEALKKRLSP